MPDGLTDEIEQERWVLGLLGRNQASREQIEAAGRHIDRLGELHKQKQGAAGPKSAPAAQPKTA